MSELMRRSDAIRRRTERRKRLRGEATMGSLSPETRNDNSSSGMDMETEEEEQQQPIENVEVANRKGGNDGKDHQLWVDKHAPTIFSHLLSDERTNREVLRALKAWDPYVFRRAAPPRPAMMQSKMLQSSSSQNLLLQ